jgi:hypothetical protein
MSTERNGESWTCRTCSDQFHTKSFFDNHECFTQTPEFRRTCYGCDDVFTSKAALFDHPCYHTPTRVYTEPRIPPPVVHKPVFKARPQNDSVNTTLFANYRQEVRMYSPNLQHPEVEDVETDINELQCAVCWDNRKVISGSCGHQLCCGCSQTIANQFSAKCPECRAPWKDFRRIY